MKDLAVWIIVFGFLLFLVLVFAGDSTRWSTSRSPVTGICYELNTAFLPFGVGMAMSVIPDEYCEEP